MILSGFLEVLVPLTLLLIFIGVILGIIFGAIPGMSAAMAIALCLPITFALTPIQGLSLLVGLYIGGISGGLISAILLKIPGTPSSIATTFDGSPMAARGEAGRALGIGITYSFIGCLISILILMFIAPPIAKFSLKFSPFEYFAVAIFSLTMIASLSEGNMLKGLLSGCIGIAIKLVGAAPIDSFRRFTFGSDEFNVGFDLLSVLIGLYAISEVLKFATQKNKNDSGKLIKFKIRGFGFSISEFRKQTVNMFRSAFIGTGIGILPGIGGATSNIIAYITAKKQSKYPEKFGTGIMDGIVASETANNASVGGALIPLLTMGIPGDTVTALMLGGFMIHGIQPGPMLFKTSGNLIYAIFASLIIANCIMLLVEFFGIRVFVKLLSIPKNILLPVIVSLCVVGAFASNNRVFDVYSMIFFGLVGFILTKAKFPLPPVILGFILASIMETNLRRGLMLSNGDFIPFLTRPIAFAFLLIAFISIIIPLLRKIYKRFKNKNVVVD